MGSQSGAAQPPRDQRSWLTPRYLGGQEKYWSLGGELPVTGGLEEAIRAAQHVAWSHRPAHPRTERGRRVYRVDERRWLVAVTGQGTAYPFEIRIVQAEPPPAPSP